MSGICTQEDRTGKTDVSRLARPSSVVRAFRFSRDLDQMLSRASTRSKINTNLFVTNTLMSRLKLDPLYPAFETVVLDKALLRSILGHIGSAQLEIIGSEAANMHVPLALDLMDGHRSKLSLLKFVRDVLSEYRWFQFESDGSPEVDKVILCHDHGYKWSLFLKSYLQSAIDVASEPNGAYGQTDITITDRVVKLDLESNGRGIILRS